VEVCHGFEILDISVEESDLPLGFFILLLFAFTEAGKGLQIALITITWRGDLRKSKNNYAMLFVLSFYFWLVLERRTRRAD
jgi:hypothetical protein